MSTNKAEIPQFFIKRIKDISFHLNEKLNDPNRIHEIRGGFTPSLGFVTETNLLVLSIRVVFQYGDVTSVEEEPLIDSDVQTVFEIPSLKSLINEKNILILPSEMIAILLGLSISHTRALLSKSCAGTAFNDLIVPVLDANEVARFFFPYMFDESSSFVTVEKSVGL